MFDIIKKYNLPCWTTLLVANNYFYRDFEGITETVYLFIEISIVKLKCVLIIILNWYLTCGH